MYHNHHNQFAVRRLSANGLRLEAIVDTAVSLIGDARPSHGRVFLLPGRG